MNSSKKSTIETKLMVMETGIKTGEIDRFFQMKIIKAKLLPHQK